MGTLVVQLLAARGVRVLGIASARSASWLTAHGVTPVEYGPGLAGLLQEGVVELPIAARYPLDRVADAFEDLERRHSLGKIVLIP